MAERDSDGNGGQSHGKQIGSLRDSLRDRQAAYLPDGYELVPTGNAKRLRLLRPDGSEVRSFERGEIKKAERAAFEDVRKHGHEDRF